MATMLLGRPKSRRPKEAMELDKLAATGVKLASGLGSSGEFADWEKKSA